jgi:biopolymer transport protein ExbD
MEQATPYEPITLHRNQFGLVAAVILLLTMIPSLLSIPHAVHLVALDITPARSPSATLPFIVEITEDGVYLADGKPVALVGVIDRAQEADIRKRAIILKPAPGVRYDLVIIAIAALKRGTLADFRLAKQYSTAPFGKAVLPPHVTLNADSLR